MGGEVVLVTGGSGFVGMHSVARLLAEGYEVRATVRSATRGEQVRHILQREGVPRLESLSFHQADLLADSGWHEAVSGCDAVWHVASPFPIKMPRDEQTLIRPAVEGTRRVLEAASAAKVKRVVLTSSMVAVAYGHPSSSRPMTEARWTNLDAPVNAYVKSKTLAERAAWEIAEREGLALSVINPVGIYGPVMSGDYADSIQLVTMMLEGKIPLLPDLAFGVVDVRDVVALHLLAMRSPEAIGERFLAVAGGCISLREIATWFNAELGADRKRLSTRRMPDWMVRVAGVFSKEMRTLGEELGAPREVSNEKAKRLLGWAPRSSEEAVMATAKSLIAHGLLTG